MNGTMSILAALSFGCVAIMGLTGSNSYLEYGALGLCAVIVYFLCNHIKHLTKRLEELSERSITAYHRLSNLLEDRPCLMQDKRIQQPEKENV